MSSFPGYDRAKTTRKELAGVSIFPLIRQKVQMSSSYFFHKSTKTTARTEISIYLHFHSGDQ